MEKSSNDALCTLKSHPPSLRSALQQEDEGKVVKSNEDYKGAAVDIQGFNSIAYKCMDMWVRFKKVQDGLHPPRDVDTAHVAELEASFGQYCVNKSSSLISVTTVQPVIEQFHL